MLFVYREEEYLRRARPKLSDAEYAGWQVEMNEVRGRAEVIIGKQRHGAMGTVEMMFDGARSILYDEGHMPAIVKLGNYEVGK